MSLASLAACGGDGVVDGGAGSDASIVDALVIDGSVDAATTVDDAGDEHDASTTGGDDAALLDASADASTTDAAADGSAGDCGSARPAISSVSGSEGLVIAADGTIYVSRARGIRRIDPDGTITDPLVTLPGSPSTVWGLALDAANTHLYVGVPGAGAIHVVDLTASPPTATVLASDAGAPNGLVWGPDDALYYSDFSGGHVHRVTADGTTTTVTATQITQPNGLAFAADGSLSVLSYGRGTWLSLTLDADHHETARRTVASSLGSPDGIALDDDGGAVISDNGGGRLLHVDDAGASTVLLTGITAAANVSFGRGPLVCTDLYVASSGALRRYEMGSYRAAPIAW